MLSELIRFEWRFHTRQPSFIGSCVLFIAVGFGLTVSGFGATNIFVTSSWLITETIAVASLFSLFAIAIFAANAVVRDREHRFEEIVFTTPVGRLQFLLGRFGGAFASAVTAFAFVLIGMLLATPFADRARVGPLHIGAYAGAFLIIGLPTILFATALLFAVAALTRSSLATYTASVFVYVLYLVCAALTDSPLMAGSKPGSGSGSAGALLDPFGLTPFFAMTRYWTVPERNQRFVGATGVLLVNRLVWLGVAAGIMIVVARAFSFRTRATPRAAKVKTTPKETFERVPYVPRKPSPSAFAAYVSASKSEIAATLRSKPFLFVLALWFVLAFTTIRGDVFGGEYGSASLPTTSLIIASLQQPITIIGLIIVIYYGSELFWREQRFRLAVLIDATPVRGWAMALSKWTAIVCLIAITIVIGIVAGMIVQLSDGYAHFDPTVYLSLFFLAGLPLALYAAAAVAIHSLSPGKYAGLVLVVLFIIVTKNTDVAGLEHPLWQFGSGPQVRHSEMAGFSTDLPAFGRLMLHWSIFAAALLAITAPLWRRLRDGALERVGHLADARSPAVVFIALLVVTGVWNAYAIKRDGYVSTAELLDWRAQYEKQYRASSSLPRPRIAAITTRVGFFPERLHIAGDYTLVNNTGAPMSTIDVSLPRGARQTKVSIDAAKLSRSDAQFGMYRFTLAPPLPPSARTTLHFAQQTLESGDASVVMSSSTFPALGYRAAFEISDPRERAKRHLGPSSTPEASDQDVLSSDDAAESQLVDFDATLSTDADQTAITTGHLERTWVEGSRRYFHYRSEEPVRNRFAIASARYAAAHRIADGVDIAVSYHSSHAANVPAMLDAAARTVAYADREFSRYPHRQLALVEVPSWWNFGGLAFPGVVLLSESRAFLVDQRDASRPDLVTRRIAHEVGHQWWGYQLIAASRGGALTLTESLAKYTELVILESVRGRDAVRTLLAYELDRYLAGRARETEHERPLTTVGDQAYLYYSKGALVMNAIRDLIGEETFDKALHQMLSEHAQTTSDLLRALRAVSNDAQYELLASWLQQIVIYDFRVGDVQVTPIANGRFKIAAQIDASRRDGDRELPLDETIDVAVFKQPVATEPVAQTRTRLHSGVNRVELVVSDRDVYVAVDPWLLRIDRTPSDNWKRLAQ